MKIESSIIEMAAASQRTESVTVERLKMTTVTDTVPGRSAERNGADENVRLNLSGTAKSLVNESNERAARKLKEAWGVSAGAGDPFELEDHRITLLRRMMELLTGKKLDDKTFRPVKLKPDGQGNVPNMSNMPGQGAAAKAMRQAALIGQRTFSTVSFSSIEIYSSESVSFQANGTVTTADGRTIDLSVALNMSQELYAKFENTIVTETSIALYDPLVINFGTATAGVSAQKFEFDLDCDGTPDQISRLLAGSGFLCLDKNGDGVINDGSELFGTQSGDGFRDLAAYDRDGNGWIDENDDIFNKLRVWVKDENGEDKLFALGEIGVGAIYLGNVSTQYSYNASGSLDGMLRSTGVFLSENGLAGTVQHVDLSI